MDDKDRALRQVEADMALMGVTGTPAAVIYASVLLYGRACADAERARADVMQRAIERYLELMPTCDYTDAPIAPSDCPGITERAVMCHWCELAQAVGFVREAI